MKMNGFKNPFILLKDLKMKGFKNEKNYKHLCSRK